MEEYYSGEISWASRRAVNQPAVSSALDSIGIRIGRAGVAKIEGGTRRVRDVEVLVIARVLRVRVGRLIGN